VSPRPEQKQDIEEGLRMEGAALGDGQQAEQEQWRGA
jgi:hypothetical protein